MDGQVDPDGVKSGNNVVEEVQLHESAMETQAQVILSRIHRLQGRQCQRHLQKHVQAFVRHEQIATGVGCQALRLAKERREPNGRYTNPKHAVMEDKFMRQDGLKSMSKSSLINLVKKLESSNYNSDGPSKSLDSMSSSPTLSKMKAASRLSSFDIPSSQHLQTPSAHHEHQLPSAIRTSSEVQLNAPENRNVIDCSVGILKHNLHHLEKDYDSDATDSSSGGDSCDESFHYNSVPLNGFVSNNSSPSTPPFSRKHSSSISNSTEFKETVSWKWAGERGAIAARWMWLFAQVADLEFKIRQQNEMYRTLRTSKGPIVLEASATLAPSQPSNNDEGQSTEDVNDTTAQCVRTMPVRELRKRRLVRAQAALAGVTRKTARYSTVQCSCSSLPSFVSPCLVCNGRYSYVQVIDTDCMPQSERIALLDSSCHPVISLPNQIPLGLHFAKFLKRETVQRSPSKNQLKNDSKRKSVSDFNIKLLKDPGTNKNNIKKSQAVISSNKLKKKYDSTTKRKNHFDHSTSGKRSKGGKRERHESSSNGSLEAESPSIVADVVPRRRRSELQHAFDINNIVIPYSIASTTRVEKLQYKEILTPKWREVDLDSEIPNPNDGEPIDGLLEDLSDVTFVERHRKCEIEERKRFLTFLTPAAGTPGAHRGRGMARCDSKSDKNEQPTTGNGFGPGPVDDQLVADQNNSTGFDDPSISPGLMKHPKMMSQIDPQVHGNPARAFERRRTTSSSRRDDSIDDDHQEVIPYEKRSFPLAETEIALLVEFEEPVPIQSNGSSKEMTRDVKRELPSSPIKEVTFSQPTRDHDTSLPATPRSDKSLSVSVSGLSASPSSGTDDPEPVEDPEWAPEVA